MVDLNYQHGRRDSFLVLIDGMCRIRGSLTSLIIAGTFGIDCSGASKGNSRHTRFHITSRNNVFGDVYEGNEADVRALSNEYALLVQHKKLTNGQDIQFFDASHASAETGFTVIKDSTNYLKIAEGRKTSIAVYE